MAPSTDVNMRDALRARLDLGDLPILFRNDAEAAVVGEARYGAGRDYRRLIGVTLGTGCGSAFLVDGVPVTSGPGVPPNGWLYPVLFRGLRADDVFSRRGLEARLRSAGVTERNVKDAAAAARAGDVGARQVFEAFGADLGSFLNSYAVAFAAEAVLVLGRIAGAMDLFGPPLRQALSVPALPGERGPDAALLGAADLLVLPLTRTEKPMSKVHTLYFIHHSHTDIGYTHDQPIVFDLHGRFLDEALHLVDKYSDRDSDGAFRWTVETTYVLYRWLQQASAGQIERFKALERAGRIEVTGMFANLTPLLDTDQLVETFQLLRPLRDDFGFTIRHAMNCDVNGENWPLVDLLLDLGIEGLTMAINTHFGGAPMQRPNVFWWEGPSGRKILAYNGWPYDTGWRFGIGRDAATFEETWWPRVERRLAEIDYPLPVLMVQSFHPFGDNGSAYEPFSRFIDTWNEQGKSPRIVMATPKDWWAAVKEHSHLLPTYRGDWTDYWNFGCISSAREQALNRCQPGPSTCGGCPGRGGSGAIRFPSREHAGSVVRAVSRAGLAFLALMG